MPESLLLQETAVLTEAAATEAKKSGRMVVQLISPGWGSSGYYSTSVLEQAVTDAVIPAGTHMYADHPTDTEAVERPGRSIKDLISVTTEAARVATAADVKAGAEEGALVAEVKVVGPYREVIEDLADAIGVSIRGDASDITIGEAEGRTGRIIEGLEHVASVDWVTRAGRGGKTLQVLESARASVLAVRRAVARGITEATANDIRDRLSGLVGEAYGSNTVWVYVCDFDESTVWFRVSQNGGDSGTYGQSYTSDSDGALALTGARTEVRAVTNYVPVSPAGSSTTESEEDTMGNIQIEEAEHSRLVETAGRVNVLESERDTAVAERDQARAELASRDRRDRATVLVAERSTEAGVTFTALEQRGLLAEMPLKDGALDEAAFTTAVDEAAAAKKTAVGEGRVRGYGAPAHQTVTEGTDVSDDDLEKAVDEAFSGIRPFQVKEA